MSVRTRTCTCLGSIEVTFVSGEVRFTVAFISSPELVCGVSGLV